MKKITLLLMLLYSFVGFGQIIDEGFEGTTFPPTNWLVTDNGVGTANSWVRSDTQPVNSGSWTGFMTRENIGVGNTAQDWLITQQIVVPAVGVHELKFFSRSTLAGNQGTIYQIRVSTNPTQSDLAAYTIVQQYTENDLSVPYTAYEEKTIDLSTFAGQNIHIAFVMVFTQPTTALGGDRWLLDDIKVAEKCLDPTNLAVSNETLTGATLSWTSNGSATQWEVEVVQVPNAPTGTGVVTSSNPVTTAALGLTLTQATQYQYYVRALCTAAGSESAWVGPFDFSTTSPGETCDAPIVIGSIPYVTSDNTNNYGDDYSGAPGCGTGNAYLNGDDVVYSFTATDNIPVTITMTPTATWSGIFVYTGCANIGVNCIAGVANSGSTPRVIVLPQTPGQIYYIVISTWGTTAATQSTGYGLTIVKNSCTNFTATFAVVPDCANGNQFFATANVTNMGTATSIVGTSNQVGDTPQTITAPGIIQFGPYPNGTNVLLNLQNADDPNCFRNSNNLTQTFCPAVNNLCSGAIPITCGSVEGQTTVGATTAGAPTFTCGTGPGSGGLWYSYVGTGDITTFSLCGSAYNTKIQVFTGSCGAFTCVGGNDDFCNTQSEVAIISTLGTVYYVYVYGTTGNQGIFTLNTTCVPPPPVPANDNCENATVVPVNTDYTCTLVTPGTILGASQSPQANTCIGTPNDDVWYQFVATQSIHLIAFQNVIGSTTNLNHGLYTSTDLTDPCANLTLVYCSDPNNSYAQNLVPGQTYFIRVYSSGTAILQNTTFNLCVSIPPPPPANDECINAVTLAINPDTSCTISTPGTVTSATPSAQPNTCAGIANDDVWYTFTATSQAHTIDLANVVGSTNNLNHAVFTSTNPTDPCANLTLVYCSDPNTNSSYNNTFVVGQTYYIRVFSSGNVLGSTANFNICVGSIAPPIATNNTQYTVPELVEDVLINSDCAIVSNITWSTGTNFGSTNGIAYFQENGSGFAFEDGIVMTTGNALNAPGPNLTTLSDGAGGGWGGDADLEAIILAATGQAMNSQNATKIEFDFVPLTDFISFNFLFASDEYGTFQCSYSDAFAFLLTNVATSTTTNLALIPGTTTPVSVVTIRNQLYNAGCASVNPEYFAFYYGTGGVNPLGAPINFNGVTVPMTASSTVVPNNLYKIKMVIADRSDTAFDSAVFLEGGSFELGDLDLGVDLLISSGNALCPAEPATIETGLNPDEFAFEWFQDGVLMPGETGPNLTVTVAGTYSVSAQYNLTSACSATDSIIVEFYEVIDPGVPETLQACDASGFSTFDLTENAALILAPVGTEYTLTYYTSQTDADDEINAITDPTIFTNTTPFLQTIYVRIDPVVGDCYEVVTFNVSVQDLTPQFTITENQDICEGTTSTIVVTPINYTAADPVTYTWTLDGNPFPGDTSSITVSQAGIYSVLIDFNGCTATGTSTVTVVQYPTVEPQTNVTVCDSYTLPVLTVGNYFTGPSGTGTLLPAETTITSTQTIYVYAANSICSDEESFVVTIINVTAEELEDVEACGKFVLPTLAAGNAYYTGQGGTGTQLASGTEITTSQTIYIYAVQDICISESSFVVTINTCTIPKGISPNGDGQNDELDLTSFGVEQLEIFNRYGVKVYSRTDYTNQWSGQTDSGDELPDGTYYYVINLITGENHTGWIYINRER